MIRKVRVLLNTGVVSRNNPSHCKNKDLAENDDIKLVQRSLVDFELTECQNKQELSRRLAECINEWVLSDFSRLIHILYSLDINEQRLQRILQENKGHDAGELIAGM